MDDLAALALHRIRDLDRRAVGELDPARITGLAAAARVEHSAVEPDAAVVDVHDRGRVLARVGVVAEDRLGHAVCYYGAEPVSRRKSSTFPRGEDPIPASRALRASAFAACIALALAA